MVAMSSLPSKLFFRIGEVAGLVGVEPHVLRYWEREFRSIRPTKSAKGQRVYSRKDVENSHHEFSVIKILKERSDKASAEAAQCVGVTDVDVDFQGSKTVATVDPAILANPAGDQTGFISTNVDVPFLADPPQCVCSVRLWLLPNGLWWSWRNGSYRCTGPTRSERSSEHSGRSRPFGTNGGAGA